MRLYKQIAKVPTGTGITGTTFKQEILFAGSQTEARGQRVAWKRAGVRDADIRTHEIDVKTSKAELLDFLNKLAKDPML